MAIDTVENHILRRLPPEEFKAVLPHLEYLSFNTKHPIFEPGQPLEFVYFPESGVESIVAYVEENEFIEVATVGKEGVVGVPIIFGAETMEGMCFCQIPGPVLRMPAVDFKHFMKNLPTFAQLMNKYAQSLFNQTAQNAACNRSHNVDSRCARWLIFCHDRMDRRNFPLTQEFLGQMLGVRRPAVNVAAMTLQKAGLISYVRGIVTVRDREGLEAASCGCYRAIADNFEKLFGKDPSIFSPPQESDNNDNDHVGAHSNESVHGIG